MKDMGGIQRKRVIRRKIDQEGKVVKREKEKGDGEEITIHELSKNC